MDVPRLRQEIGARIQAARERAGLSQAELGRRIGQPRAVISRWEAGRHFPALAALAQIGAECNAEFEDLVGTVEDWREWSTSCAEGESSSP